MPLFRSLQRTLDELRDYQERHEHWQQQQEKLVSEQAPQDLKFQQRVAFEEMRAKRDEAGFGNICIEYIYRSCFYK